MSAEHVAEQIYKLVKELTPWAQPLVSVSKKEQDKKEVKDYIKNLASWYSHVSFRFVDKDLHVIELQTTNVLGSDTAKATMKIVAVDVDKQVPPTRGMSPFVLVFTVTYVRDNERWYQYVPLRGDGCTNANGSLRYVVWRKLHKEIVTNCGHVPYKEVIEQLGLNTRVRRKKNG